ncbi:hypothetical protein MBLNU230_g6699t1 [Neophaeotheca triangularis]
MGDSEASPIVNRDDPIPVVGFDKFREKAVGKIKDKMEERGPPTASSRLGLQDRFFAGIMSSIIPSEGPGDDDDDETKPKDYRSRKYVDRPNFSVGLMSANFRRFNARVGIIFVFQNRLIHLFTWRRPTQTLSFLGVYTLLCLEPSLIPLVPLILVLFYIMIPSFLARHPAPTNDPRIEPARYGPPIAPPSRVKPAPELSKDFFRNMRDLQNSMEDFSRLHDTANEYVTPYTNFSDEELSSTLFLVLFLTANAAFLASHLVPWRLVFLLTGWTSTGLCHPESQHLLLSSHSLKQARLKLERFQSHLRDWIIQDIVLDEPGELRQVEVFELQKHHPASGQWEAWLFTPAPYDPLSPSRIAGERPKGTQFFEEVAAPEGWRWKDKKWNLDLWSREWVEGRMITGVEVETEGERWVYDLPDVDVEGPSVSSPDKGKAKKVSGLGTRKAVARSGWEEGTGRGERGVWRRRRWVRWVERRIVKASPADAVAASVD